MAPLPILTAAHERARQALPDDVWRWLQAGADGRADSDAWNELAVRPRVLRDVGTVDPGVRVLGRSLASPVLIAPVGYQQLLHPDAELGTGRAGSATGAPFIVSTRSTTRFADLATVTADWWLQVYVMRDRELTAELVRRAVARGAGALVLTGDTPFLGGQADSGRQLGTSHLRATNLDGLDLADEAATAQDPTADLDVIGWLRELSGLPVLVKGVLRADDAVACVDAGAAGVIVSNHGRRQAARAVSTASALPGVVAAVGDRAEVLVDGGIRDGTAVLCALAMGARAVLVGRPVMEGLAADGATGATTMIRALIDDFARQLALVGARSAAELTPEFIGREPGGMPTRWRC